MTDLVSPVLSGNRRALARLLTQIQDETDEASRALAALYPHTGRAHLVGITGAPGTGKSSLVNALAVALRAAGRTVGILAVDPTSPFSGGAVLGDRIRMRDLSGDPGIFIRSMATRGSLGGLARTTGDAIRALDAAGYEMILVETVGAGQSEVDIAHEAHTTLVVEAPGMGDDIQAIKAGILEIADILVVNKADRPDADRTIRTLRAMLELNEKTPEDTEWATPIMETVATDGTGIPALVEALDRHRDHLRATGQLRQWERRRLEKELTSRLQAALLVRLLGRLAPQTLPHLLDQLVSRQLDPASAVEHLLQDGHFSTSNPAGATEL
ncbi:MAG: methylmalonyl Co-A mutase-associated GTPase MeaB [Anaerolineae bacterium]|nr:methylmalonyl Co-A mutase-associated GTPase MeaB [Anaerolineae bacterium]